jgi:hypothetical protein
MLKKLGIPTLALAVAMAVAAPSVTLARDRDDYRGRGFERHEMYRGREQRVWRDNDRGRFSFGINIYRAPIAPQPVANGYYDEYGVWHAYGFYDQYGNWHPYGY